MTIVRVNSFSISLDGYAAGPNQSLDAPLGIRGPELFERFFATQTWKQMHGGEGGSTGIDDQWARPGMQNVGAWILGRNMFGPVRGPWPDDSWKGWWGEEPPYHVPAFVLTHHPRTPLEMKGGTTFHFVTDGIESALNRARDAAQQKDVRIGGGVATSNNTCVRGSSTNCTSLFARSFSARVKICSPASILRNSAIVAANTVPPNPPFT